MDVSEKHNRYDGPLHQTQCRESCISVSAFGVPKVSSTDANRHASYYPRGNTPVSWPTYRFSSCIIFSIQSKRMTGFPCWKGMTERLQLCRTWHKCVISNLRRMPINARLVVMEDTHMIFLTEAFPPPSSSLEWGTRSKKPIPDRLFPYFKPHSSWSRRVLPPSSPIMG